MHLANHLGYRDGQPHAERRVATIARAPGVEKLVKHIGIRDKRHRVADEAAGGAVEQEVLWHREPPALTAMERMRDEGFDPGPAVVRLGVFEDFRNEPLMRGY